VLFSSLNLILHVLYVYGRQASIQKKLLMVTKSWASLSSMMTDLTSPLVTYSLLQVSWE